MSSPNQRMPSKYFPQVFSELDRLLEKVLGDDVFLKRLSAFALC